MTHLAYPNTKGEQFVGCGRFAVFIAGEQPEEHYEVADPECPTLPEIVDAASILAPEPVPPQYIIYETRDNPEQHYLGNSLGFAYLLALISRTRTLRLDAGGKDIWCTGCIALAGEQPVLKSVVSAGFEIKLRTFLSPDNPDILFIVSEANIDQPLHLLLNTREDINVLTLNTLPWHRRLEQKTILKVRRNELPALIDVMFELLPVDTQDEKRVELETFQEDTFSFSRASSPQMHTDEGQIAEKSCYVENNQSFTRQEAIQELRNYGIEEAQLYLIDFIPLIEMLWADGQAQVGEVVILSDYIKRHVEHVNHIVGREVLTVESAQMFVGQFLEERPSPELLRTLRTLIAPVRLSGSDTAANKALRESLLAACLDIASSSVTEYPYKHQNRFNLEEKRCFFEILESLEQGS